ncbi:N-acetylmuramoyl-L-alanine amidase family protein [Collinsella sp. AF23-2]|uniref:N-acetylmuramoyl-L-alanine amidase family protein n=2 Tax=unclassified Collinsella TaxID=2637548 RepID=UPI000E51C21A|nr:N-acetylmuramoyl-L-alanine amidase family protein [Collinsella sp. AF23-3LB]RGS22979.1 N-acetylmuramoyl-L-alanine amidase family protein [Collinsella sp. AF23-3LB]RGS25720.1 N-acetylmuramoyl-L-alanine amidase family protein [Collinsella sp. AF23-2]
MNNLRERWRGLTALGVAVFAAACMTVVPAPSFADIDSLVGLQYIDHSESRNLTGFSVSRPAGTYYFDNDGSMQTELVRCEDGNLRYFDPETGVMVTNQWYNDYEAVWYYFGADGTAVSNWQLIGGDWYYFYPENHDMAYGRVQIDGKNYFLNTPGANADGRMQHSGWIYDSIYGKWLYATSSGELLTGWHNIGGTWYYFNEYGVMLTGWINDSGTWYYANASGAMATGWLNIGGAWFYLDGSGAMVANGWRSLGGSWYWFDDSGAMATGWRQVGGAWYYFSGSGAMAHDAWVGDYYLQSSGAMATNAWVGSYYVGEDGKWIPGYGLVWYKNGSDVYHTHKCRTVGKDAKGYSQISIQEAQRRGASRECKNCQQIG